MAQVPGSGRTFAFRKVTRSDLSVSFKEVGNDVTCTITAAGPDRSVRLGTATVSCGADVEAAYKAAYVRALLDAESGVSV